MQMFKIQSFQVSFFQIYQQINLIYFYFPKLTQNMKCYFTFHTDMQGKQCERCTLLLVCTHIKNTVTHYTFCRFRRTSKIAL